MNALAGLGVAVTRAASQSEELAEPLRRLGARVLVAPLIRSEPLPLDAQALLTIADAHRFDWIVFTSANGVQAFSHACRAQSAQPLPVRVACVGPATTAAARQAGFDVALMPGVHTGEAVADALIEQGVARQRILLARGEGGQAALPERLRAVGAEVVDLHLYRTEMDRDGADLLEKSLQDGQIGLLTFTSGSAIRYFVQSAGMRPGVRVAVIGSSTAHVAAGCGLRVDIQAPTHTIAALVAAIRDYYAAPRGSSEDWNVGK